MSANPDTANRGVDPDPHPWSTIKWGLVGTTVTVLVIILCMVGYELQVRAENAAKAGTTEHSAARRLRTDQQSWLEHGHPDRNRISIDEAMVRIVDEAR